MDALLNSGADKDCPDWANCTPLHHAAARPCLGVVETLLAAGVDVGATNGLGDTALHFSARDGHDEILCALLRGGADKNCRNLTGETPLVKAVVEYQLKVVKTLLASGAEVNIAIWDGDTALHFAVDSVDMTSLLLLWGADENATDSSGMTPAKKIDGMEPKPQHKAVRRLLDRAPADRAWRRRGWLVMFRSRTPKEGAAGGDEGTRSVKMKKRGGDGREGSDLVSVVARLGVVEDALFRNVVSFL